MNVVYVTLLAMGAMLGMVFVTLPLIAFMKGLEAWRNIPREAYAANRQRLFGLRPTTFWVASAILSHASRLFNPLGWKVAGEVGDNLGLVLLSMVLIYQLVWAIRIIHTRATFDPRLVRFARYAFWGCSVYLFAVGMGIMEFLLSK